MYSVSSWFQVKLEDRSSEPVRQFLVGTSDYSDRVIKWPKIKRTSNSFRPVRPTINLDNADGGLNHFYETTVKMVQECYLKLGFTHATSGTEYVTVYTGNLKDVRYSNRACQIKTRDKLFDFTERKVGDSETAVVFSETIPSDIAWTLCSCYGGLCNSKSTGNNDIDYTVFNAWAKQFSADSIIVNAYYDGLKVTEALTRLCKMTDSVSWVEGNGKVNFRKFVEPGSHDITLTRDEYSDILIDVEQLRITNKAFVYWDYDINSEYWAKSCISQESTSVNSFGLHENMWKDETVWYVNSAGALNFAQRQTALLKDPPKSFKVEADLYAMRQQLGETIRLVDSFYNITSMFGWRLAEAELNMETGEVKLEMDEALTVNAFYLDMSLLDGDEYLL